MKNCIKVVIVTFNNRSMLESLVDDLWHQMRKPDEIVIIDNGNQEPTDTIGKDSRIRYVRLEENMGSAGGYYEGLKIASKDSDFVWTLDDDMSLNVDAIEVLEKWWGIISSKENNLGAIRSWIGDAPADDKSRRIDTFAWRGTFLKSDVIRRIGLPLKEYFLYAEDVEYAYRITKNGYRMFIIPESCIKEERIDDKIRINIFGKKRILYKDRFRYYYAIRNQIDLSLRYRKASDFLKTLLHVAKVILILVVFRYSRVEGLMTAVIDGLRDGINSKLGKNPKYIP